MLHSTSSTANLYYISQNLILSIKKKLSLLHAINSFVLPEVIDYLFKNKTRTWTQITSASCQEVERTGRLTGDRLSISGSKLNLAAQLALTVVSAMTTTTAATTTVIIVIALPRCRCCCDCCRCCSC